MRMKPTTPLSEILEMQTRASQLALQIQEQLAHRPSPDQIVPLLKEQSQVISHLQTDLKNYTPDKTDRENFERLKEEFKLLVKRTEQNYQTVSRKGIRLAGVGGKPYTYSGTKTR